MSEDTKSYPIVIDNSPVEFALMGPIGRHRGVLVKTKGAPADLIGFDNPLIDQFSGRSERESLGKTSGSRLLINIFNKQTTYVVRADNASVPNAETRKTYFSFAWKGLCDPYDFRNFDNNFSIVARDLNEAFKHGEPSEIEWTMSALIASCDMMNKRAQIRQKVYRTGFIIYTIVAFVVLAIAIGPSFLPIVIRS